MYWATVFLLNTFPSYLPHYISNVITFAKALVGPPPISFRTSLLKRLFRCRSKKRSKLRVTGLFAGNSPATGEFPAQMASNAENASIWWRHHDTVTTPDKNQVKSIALYILRNYANESTLLQWISTYLWGWTHHNDEKPPQAQEFDTYSTNRYQVVIFWWVLCHRKIGTSWMPIWLFNN